MRNALLLWALQVPALAQQSLVLLANDGPLPREELVSVSVPFAPGVRRELSDLQVEGRPTAWRPLLRWPDGSLAVAQAQFPVKPGGWLAPGEILNLPLRPGQALAGPCVPHAWVAREPPDLAVEIDWDGRRSRFPLEGGGEPLAETPLSRTSRFEGVLAAQDGAEMRLTVFMTVQSVAPIIALDLVATALAACRPRHLDLVSGRHPALVQDSRRHGSGVPFLDEAGLHRAPLLRELAFAPGQGRRWRLLILVEDPEAGVLARGLARRTWQASAQLPLRALCDAASWQRSGALTLLGGPAFPPPDWERRVRAALGRWHLGEHFGAFGSFGLPGPEGPASAPWVWAVQTSRGRLLDLLEGYAWQQACRPGALSTETAHGWERFDPSGRGLAHLFSYWLATGDPWSREQLGRLARYAFAETELGHPFLDEGSLGAGLLRLHLATGDPRLLDPLRERLETVWLPRLRAAGPAQAAREVELLWSLLALWRRLGWPAAAEAIAALVGALPEERPALPLAGALRLAAQEPGLAGEIREKARELAERCPPPPDQGWNPWTFLISGESGSEWAPARGPAREP